MFDLPFKFSDYPLWVRLIVIIWAFLTAFIITMPLWVKPESKNKEEKKPEIKKESPQKPIDADNLDQKENILLEHRISEFRNFLITLSECESIRAFDKNIDVYNVFDPLKDRLDNMLMLLKNSDKYNFKRLLMTFIVASEDNIKYFLRGKGDCSIPESAPKAWKVASNAKQEIKDLLNKYIIS